jgi:hypothetical protein
MMKFIMNENEMERVVVALGGEEAVILLQPGEMFRAVLDRNPSWAEACRFLTSLDPAGGMAAVLPRLAGPAWLKVLATHQVEREFQELLFDHLHP